MQITVLHIFDTDNNEPNKERSLTMIIQKIIGRLQRMFGPQSVVYQHTVLPAKYWRFCGPEFSQDVYFFASAIAEARRLIDSMNLTSNSSVLDIGCGFGRLPIGLLKYVEDLRQYVGIDVSKKAIRWCQRFITPQQPNFQFIHIDVKNIRYNPRGNSIDTAFRLPFADQSFDIIYLYSVFSHMSLEDVRVYLQEFRRLLKLSGNIFLTTFIETDVPDFTVNPENYRSEKWQGPLHCVRFNKAFFTKLLAEYDFQIDRFDYEAEANGQSGVFISRK